MKKNQILVFILIAMTGGILLLMFMANKQPTQTANPIQTTNSIQTEITNCVPTFVDGGGPYYKTNVPFRQKIVPEQNNGERLIVRGKILRNDCKTPVANAVLDIWQADETGTYQDEWYRGKVKSDNNGNYSFETIVPKGYGEGTGYRPPHIHFKVFINDTEIITSQMFFPEAKGKPGFNDAYIMKLESKKEGSKTIHTGIHNIILPIKKSSGLFHLGGGIALHLGILNKGYIFTDTQLIDALQSK